MPVVNIEGIGPMNFPDSMSQDEIANAIHNDILPKFPELAAKTKRGWGEAATDIASSLGSGVGQLAQLPGQISQLAGLTTAEDADKGLQGLGKQLEEFSQESKSTTLKGKEAMRAKKIEAADGMLAEFGTAIKETIKDPALLTSFFTEQLPNLAGSWGGGLLARGATKTLMRATTEEAIGKMGVRGAVGTGAVMQGADVGSDTYTAAFKELKKQGMDDEQANAIALSKGRMAAIEAAGISLASARLPGGATIEQALAGKGITGGAKGFLKGLGEEAISEGLEEGGGKFASNVGLQEINPEQSLTKGIGAAAGMGALGGGLFGGVAGSVNQSREDQIAAAAKEIEDAQAAAVAAQEAAAQAEDQALRDAYEAEQYDTQLRIMRERGGYLGSAAYDELLQSVEASKAKLEASQQKAEAAKQAKIEQEDALKAKQSAFTYAEPDAQGIMTAARPVTEADFKEMGIGPTNKKLREQILGKNLSDPKVAAEVKTALEEYAGGNRSAKVISGVESFLTAPEFKPMPQPKKRRMKALKPTAEEVLSAEEQASLQDELQAELAQNEQPTIESEVAGEPTAPIRRAGKSSVRVPSVGPVPTAGIGETERRGVAPAGDVTGQPIRAEVPVSRALGQVPLTLEEKAAQVIAQRQAPKEAYNPDLQEPTEGLNARQRREYKEAIGNYLEKANYIGAKALDAVAADLHIKDTKDNFTDAKRAYRGLSEDQKAYVDKQLKELGTQARRGAAYSKKQNEEVARRKAFEGSLEEGEGPLVERVKQGASTEALTAAVRSGNLSAALNAIAKDTSDTFNILEKLVSNRLLANKGSLPKIEIVPAGTIKGGDAQYNPFTDTVQINEGQVDSHTVLHETVHGFLHALIQKFEGEKGIKNKGISDLKNLYDFIKENHPNVAKEYGMSSLTEFASELMSNRDFQQTLAQIPYRTEHQSLFTAFVRAVLNALGLSPTQKLSALASGLMAADRSMAMGRKVQEDVVTGKETMPVVKNTDAFRRWFKDSKAVDENGEPLVVYHGTKTFEGNVFKPTKAENRSGNISGYYFSPDPKDANYYARHNKDLALREEDTFGEGSEVIPTYIRIENPYTPGESIVTPAMREQYMKEMISHNQHMSDEKLKSWAESKMYYLDEYGYPYIDAIGNDGDAFQRIIKAGGYDGYKDGRHWVAFEPNQIKSVFNKTPTEDLSIVKVKRDDLKANYEATGAGKRAKPTVETGPFQAAKETFKSTDAAKQGFARFLNTAETMLFSADAALNNAIRSALESGGKSWDTIKQMMFDISTAQATHADAVAMQFLEKGDLEYDTKAHKWVAKEAKDSWAGLVNQISTIAKKYDVSFEEMNNYAQQAFVAERLKGLSKAKREVFSHMTPEQIEAGVKFFDMIPELRSVQKSWNEVRKNAMAVAIQGGLYNEAQAKELLDIMDYVPFYRIEQLAQNAGPKEYGRGLIDFAKGFKLEGSDQEVANIFDNMERWTSYTVSRAVKNRTALSLYNTAKQLFPDEVTDLRIDDRTKREQNTIDLWVDGNRRKVEFKDPLFIHAFNGIEAAAIPHFGAASAVANFLRKNIVLMPLFSISQLSQDSFGAMLTSGLKHPWLLPLEVAKEFTKTLRGRSEAAKELTKYGAVGVRDYSATMVRDTAEIMAGLKEDTKTGKFKSALETFAMASDNAVRQAIYNMTMKETGDKALAVERAFEIINFKRAGASGKIQMMRQVVPFFGAYLQAQNVIYKVVSGKGIAPQQRKEALRVLASNALKISALAFMYAAIASDDEDYQKMDPTIRDRHLLIPGTSLMLPMRSDLTLMPKLIAEYTYLGMTDNAFTDGKKIRRAMGDALSNAILSPTAVPQAVKPILEVATNHNFFTGRSIVGQGIANKITSEQYTNSTSELAKLIGKTGMIAPVNVDHLIKGYLGTTGGLGLMATNSIVNGVSDQPKPEKSWQDAIASTPGLSAFVAREYGNADKNDFYELREEVDKINTTLNAMKKQGRMAEAKELFAENKDLLKVKKQVNNINRQLTKLREYENHVYDLPESKMDAEKKGQEIKKIREQEKKLLKNVHKLRVQAGY